MERDEEEEGEEGPAATATTAIIVGVMGIKQVTQGIINEVPRTRVCDACVQLMEGRPDQDAHT